MDDSISQDVLVLYMFIRTNHVRTSNELSLTSWNIFLFSDRTYIDDGDDDGDDEDDDDNHDDDDDLDDDHDDDHDDDKDDNHDDHSS